MISAETYNADYEKAVKFGYNKGVDEFAEAIKNAYASMRSVSEVERATANTIAMGIADQLKEE